MQFTCLRTFATLATEAANFSGEIAESINNIVTQSTVPAGTFAVRSSEVRSF